MLKVIIAKVNLRDRLGIGHLVVNVVPSANLIGSSSIVGGALLGEYCIVKHFIKSKQNVG